MNRLVLSGALTVSQHFSVFIKQIIVYMFLKCRASSSVR